jgi:hypothetical protein
MTLADLSGEKKVMSVQLFSIVNDIDDVGTIKKYQGIRSV